MSKHALIAIGGGGLSALAALMALTGVAAPLPLLMVGLGLGPFAVGIAGATGFFAVGLLGGAFAAGQYALAFVLPAWLVTRQTLLRQTTTGGAVAWYPAGSVLASLSLLAGTFYLLIAVVIVGLGSDFRGELATYMDQEVFGRFMPHVGQDPRDQRVMAVTAWFPGFLGAFWIVMTVVNAVLAQGWLIKLRHNLRPSPSYAGLHLPDWVSWPFIVVATVSLIADDGLQFAARNLAMILAVPFFLLGLTIVHTIAHRVNAATVVLVGFYGVLVVAEPIGALMVAALGMLEQWVGLRSRLSSPGTALIPGDDEDD